MKNDVLSAFDFYFNKAESSINYFGSGDGARFIAKFIQSTQTLSADAPDAFFVDGGSGLLIEHFEFDNSKNGKSGSEFRQEMARIDRNQELLEGNYFYQDKLSCSSSYDNYICNVIKTFEAHYKKIPFYMKSIQDKGILSEVLKIKIMFLIEDVSILDSIVFDRDSGKQYQVLLAQSKEFIELLKERKDVNYVLACSKSKGEPNVWFIDNEEIDKYNHIIDYAKMDFLSFEPKVMSFKV